MDHAIQEFYEVWESGGNTSALICITNQNFEPSGNDFAIDDIFFGELCTDEEEFTVTLEEFPSKRTLFALSRL
ncbi:MAG: hypothetical protein LC127_10350 [Chitinophagales bacterium]|nr:hypothetical protein [Chitinophagales bacterium]